MKHATKNFLLAPGALLAAGLLAGCAGPVKGTGYHASYLDWNHRAESDTRFRTLTEEDASLEKFFPSQQALEELESEGTAVPSLEAAGISPEAIEPILFVVNAPEWQSSTEFDTAEEEAILFTVRERFYRYLLREYPHPVRVRYAYVPEDPITDGYRIVEVDTAVTDVNRGTGWLRYIIGYGAGAASLQLEGRLREGNTTLAEFATREDHAAYPNGFVNTRVFNDAYTLRYAAEEAIGQITTDIRATIPPARLRGGDPGALARQTPP